MRFYNKYFANNFEELITYYPRFYRDVFEMMEILKAHGRIADTMEDNIEQTYLNSFIDYADEATIEKLEKFLMIGLNKSRTLEERRRLVKSYFVGFGKVSASMLASMIESYTHAPVDIYFEPSDEERNNTLYINFQRGSEVTLYMSDIILLLSKKLPAHINWQAAVVYRFPIGIGARRRYYKYGFEICGLKPDIAMLGAIVAAASVIEAKRKHGTVQHRQAAEADELTGLHPDIATIGALLGAESVVGADREIYTSDYKTASDGAQEAGEWPERTTVGQHWKAEAAAGARSKSHVNDYEATGTKPEAAAQGAMNKINAGAGATVTDYGVDYIYCGTRNTQS